MVTSVVQMRPLDISAGPRRNGMFGVKVLSLFRD
jgi:hypothetical protein